MDLESLKKRYSVISDKIRQIELENAMKRKKREEYREEIKSLGFDPDKLDTQIPAIQAKIEAKLQEIESQVGLLEKELIHQFDGH